MGQWNAGRMLHGAAAKQNRAPSRRSTSLEYIDTLSMAVGSRISCPLIS
jgi:hypothetical protein